MNFQDFKKRYQKKEPKEYPNQVNCSPMVSVLVQTYQHEKYIRECLEGILKQKTDFLFEIVLGEDCSHDGTREICIRFAENYPEKIRLFLHHPENKINVLNTTTGNFNALYNFYSSRGEFIAFCEGDDVWTDPLKLQKQIAHLKSHSSLAFTYHSYLEVNERLQPLSKEKCLEQPKQNISKEDLQRLIFHPLLSTICFRNFFKDTLPKEMIEVLNVDSFLISLLGIYGEAEFMEDIEPSFYRRHPEGIWSKRSNQFKNSSKKILYRKLQQYYKTNNKPESANVFTKKMQQIKKMSILIQFKNFRLIKVIKELVFH